SPRPPGVSRAGGGPSPWLYAASGRGPRAGPGEQGPAGAPAMTGALAEVTTVADDEIVVHVPTAPGLEDDGTVRVVRRVGLDPDSDHHVEGMRVRTLARPPGERLATIATVNDVHFGELECGVIEGLEVGPVLRAGPGERPYPETMNRGAATEIAAAGVDVVVAKGDLTAHGTTAEYEAFLDCYGV